MMGLCSVLCAVVRSGLGASTFYWKVRRMARIVDSLWGRDGGGRVRLFIEFLYYKRYTIPFSITP